MDFRALATARESVRAYDPLVVPPEGMILDVLQTASLAPSAVNRQPWTFHVLRSHAALEGVRAAYTRDWFLDAPCVVAVTGSRKTAWTRSYDGWNSLETDLAIAAAFLVLAATEKGLGTCWISNFEPDVLRTALGLAPGEECWCITPLAWPAGKAPAPGEAGQFDPRPRPSGGSANPDTLKKRKDIRDLVVWR